MNWRPKKRTYKLPNGKTKTVWIARYKDDRGRIKIAKPAWNDGSGTFELRREAQRAIDEALAARQPERAESVSGYLPRWLETRPRSERTDRTNEGRIKAVLDVDIEGLRLGDWDMRDLKRRHRDELTARLLVDQGRSPGGARNILRALSAMFEDAITDELAEINPWQGAKVRDDDRRATKRARRLRVFTFEQLHDLAASASYRRSYVPKAGKPAPVAAPASVYEPMVRTLADCGLRIGELFALQRSDLDIQAGLITVGGTAWEGRVTGSSEEKNHERQIPVPPGCLALLRAMPTRIDTPWLFPTPTGKLWRYSNWHRKVWQPTCERAGIDPTPHELRHSWVSHLRAAAIDPADLADVAGHGIEVATSRYTHALRRSFDQIREVVG
jgi:integrase